MPDTVLETLMDGQKVDIYPAPKSHNKLYLFNSFGKCTGSKFESDIFSVFKEIKGDLWQGEFITFLRIYIHSIF